MGLRGTSLVLYILFILLTQHNVPSVSSLVVKNHEILPLTASKQDVVGFEGKVRELVVVIKKGGGGGGGGHGEGGGGGRGSRSRSRGGAGVIYPSGAPRSSCNKNLGGFGWLSLFVLAGLFML